MPGWSSCPPRPWMRQASAGDVVLAVQDRPVRDLASFRQALAQAWEATPAGAWMVLRTRRGQQLRRIEFRKPAPEM